MNPYMTAKDWGEGKIDLRHHRPLHKLRLIELHHKSDGAKDDGPSFVIVMQNYVMTVCGEVTLATLNDTLGQIGYEIRKLLS